MEKMCVVRCIIDPLQRMTKRERFLNVFKYREVDHVPDVEFGYWSATLHTWHQQGLPENISDDVEANTFFGFEGRRSEVSVGEKIPLGVLFDPPIALYRSVVPFRKFKVKILRESEGRIVVRDEAGLVSMQFRSRAGTSIPQYMEYPVEDRESWEKYRARYNLEEIRYPEKWEEMKERYARRTYPLGVDGGGYFGWARHLMGLERLSIAFHTNPDLIREMFKFRTEMVLRAIERAVKEVKPKIDFAHWWEDMCYNKGPLISPKLFKEFMVPEYKRITSFLKDHEIWINILDCDGDVDSLVPLWLEAGINCMFPLERKGKTDPLEIREKHGRNALLLGGVDKMVLLKGRKAIDLELKRLRPLIEEGGYIPHIDHRVPSDVTYENYLHYLREKRKIIFEVPGMEPDYYYDSMYKRDFATMAL